MSSKKAADGSKREVSVSGMSFLRGSANYVWCTTSVLGKGATGAVFQGVNRHSGEAVAVKTFNQMSHMRPQEVQMREFEVLKKVNHHNIVKLLAIEEEQEGRGKVIVMELCTGGSLFNILDDPENSHGLEEGEFLLVLHHLAGGMKHLRDNHIVHRDLKPGNIMKFVGLDGATHYKLTDFGAARELEDDQQFMSLYGTEEYLHPDMYERAVLRKTMGKSFGANVDLWSIGVTLFHVATGMLPFRPHGGRRNKETMYRITTEKQPGVIAGVQTSENGPIDWSKDLPPTCQLSLGVRKLVTPLLGGLLEVDPERMWKFERFFSEVTSLLERKRIYVFHVNKVNPIAIYMQSDHKYDQLQSLIRDQSDVNPEHQLLLCNNKILHKLLYDGDETLAVAYPTTTPEEPVILFSTHDQDIVLTLPKTPSLKFSSFPNVVSVDQDALTGKSICSVGHAVARMIRHHASCVALVHRAVDSLSKVLVNEVKEMVVSCNNLAQSTQTTSDSFTQLVTHHRRFLAACLIACPNNSNVGGGSSRSSVSLNKSTTTNIKNEATANKIIGSCNNSSEPYSDNKNRNIRIQNDGAISKKDGSIYSRSVRDTAYNISVDQHTSNSVSDCTVRSNARGDSDDFEIINDSGGNIKETINSTDGNNKSCDTTTRGEGENNKNNITALRDQLEDLVNNIVDEEKKVRTSMTSLSGVVEHLSCRLVDCNVLEQQWQQHVATVNSTCTITTIPPTTAGAAVGKVSGTPGLAQESTVDAMSKAPAVAGALVAKLKDSWQHLLRDRAARALTFNDEQFHLLEKLKMKETAKCLECLLSSCGAALHATTDTLADWCKVAQVQRVQVDIASSDLVKQRVNLARLSSRLRHMQDDYHSLAGRLLNCLQDRRIMQGVCTPLAEATEAQTTEPHNTNNGDNSGNNNSDNNNSGNNSKSTKHRDHKHRTRRNAAVIKQLERVSEKQEATFRLLEEARTLTSAFARAAALPGYGACPPPP